ncbi:hypothetical protein FRC12_019050 [Ceratobasidium sp. 428]|nr:hypothetical protein FRC12_019050 [Ceratobasidium sp. 428]
MPANDPADQQAARALESSLREAVNRLEQPPVELEWLMALPKRIRRSAQLIEAAQTESRVLLEHVRTEWTRARRIEQEREERLARARAQPRNLECLQPPEAQKAWHGVGRRKERCCRFDAIGRTYSLRNQLTQSQTTGATTNQASKATVLSVEADSPPSTPSVPSTPDVPTRPPTPEGLREAAFDCVGLLALASGINPYGRNSPYPMPPVPTCVIRRAPSPVPPPEPFPAYHGETTIGNAHVDWRMAYIIAIGRHSWYPHMAAPTLRAAAKNILDTELLHPGLLTHLSELFFPRGFGDWSLARPRLLYILDFCAGWFALAPVGR